MPASVHPQSDYLAPSPRVVVTGLGMVSAAGPDVGSAWKLIREGRSALAPVALFDSAPYGGAMSGEAGYLEREAGEDRSLQLLRLACVELLADAGWTDEQRGGDTGVVLGTCQGAIENARAIHRGFSRRPHSAPTAEDRRKFAEYRPGFGTEFLADLVGAEGPRATVGMVCVSSSMAIIHALDLLRRGTARRVVAGGFEGFSQFVFSGFHCIGALATGPLRPFDEDRDGTVLGEAAVLLTLETLEDAQARGAHIYAEVLGGGYAADAFHMTAPDPTGRGLERAIRHAFEDSGLGANDVDYVCAHGTGTVFNDGMERVTFERLFAEAAAQGKMPAISSMKSVFGHTLGAAGALDAVASVLALDEGLLPPSVALEKPIADWDFVRGAGRDCNGELQVALSTNSAFGGNNSALVLRRHNASGQV